MRKDPQLMIRDFRCVLRTLCTRDLEGGAAPHPTVYSSTARLLVSRAVAKAPRNTHRQVQELVECSRE